MAVNPFKPSGNVARQMRLLAKRDKDNVVAGQQRKALDARAAKSPKGGSAKAPNAGTETPRA